VTFGGALFGQRRIGGNGLRHDRLRGSDHGLRLGDHGGRGADRCSGLDDGRRGRSNRSLCRCLVGLAGKPATEVITDEAWLKGEFIATVQQRGAAIIKARGLSSAASAANAVVDSVRSIVTPTAAGDWASVCLCSDGSYGVEKGLISSFPVRSNGSKLEIVQGLSVSEFSRGKIDATVNELKEEKSLVSELLPK